MEEVQDRKYHVKERKKDQVRINNIMKEIWDEYITKRKKERKKEWKKERKM